MSINKTRPSSQTLDDVENRIQLLHRVEERFGIPVGTFDAFLVVRTHQKTLSLIPRDHRPPVQPTPTAMGLPFLRIHLKVPKLTTGAALQFGLLATQNVVPVEAMQARAYLAREPLSLTKAQTAACTGRGYVLLRYSDLILGVGFYEGPPQEKVQSYFPKAWMRKEVQI